MPPAASKNLSTLQAEGCRDRPRTATAIAAAVGALSTQGPLPRTGVTTSLSSISATSAPSALAASAGSRLRERVLGGSGNGARKPQAERCLLCGEGVRPVLRFRCLAGTLRSEEEKALREAFPADLDKRDLRRFRQRGGINKGRKRRRRDCGECTEGTATSAQKKSAGYCEASLHASGRPAPPGDSQLSGGPFWKKPIRGVHAAPLRTQLSLG